MLSLKNLILLAFAMLVCAENWCTMVDKSCTHGLNCTDDDAVGYCCDGMCSGDPCSDEPMPPLPEEHPLPEAYLGETCNEETHCGGGLVCVSSVCQRDVELQGDGCPCTDDLQCLDNICFEGVCQLGYLDKGEYCTVDRACASGSCIDNACAAGSTPRGEPCFHSGECAEGLHCFDGFCYDESGPGEGDPCGNYCPDPDHACVGMDTLVCTVTVERNVGESCMEANEYCTEGSYCGLSSGFCIGVGSAAEGEECDMYCACGVGHACILNETTGLSYCTDVSANTECTPVNEFDDCGRDRYCGCTGNSFSCMDGEPFCGVPMDTSDGGGHIFEEESEDSGISTGALLQCSDEYLALADLCNDGTMTAEEAFKSCPDIHFATAAQVTAMVRLHCCILCDPPFGITTDEIALWDMQIGRYPLLNCDELTVELPGEAECSATTEVLFDERVQFCDVYNAARPTLVPASFTITVVLHGLSDTYYQANRAAVEEIVRLYLCDLPDAEEATAAGVTITVSEASYDAATGSHTFVVSLSVPSQSFASLLGDSIRDELQKVEEKNILLSELLPVEARASAAVAVTLSADGTVVSNPTEGSSAGTTGGGGATTGTNATDSSSTTGGAASIAPVVTVLAVGVAVLL